MNRTKIGAVIRRRRKALGLNQTELAERMGKSQNTVSGLERGLWTPNWRLLEDLAHEFGTTMAELVAEAEAEEDDEDASAGPRGY
jgi:transcriptional regulator with XRE-family HTH domain